MQNSLKYLLPDISRTLSAPRLPRFLHSRLSISDPCLQSAPPGVGARRRVGVGGVALAASRGLGSSARRALNWQLGVAEHGGPATTTSRWSYTAGGRRRPARCPAQDPASGGRRRGAGRLGPNPAFLRPARSPFSSADRFRRRSGSRGGAGARSGGQLGAPRRRGRPSRASPLAPMRSPAARGGSARLPCVQLDVAAAPPPFSSAESRWVARRTAAAWAPGVALPLAARRKVRSAGARSLGPAGPSPLWTGGGWLLKPEVRRGAAPPSSP